MATTPSLTAQAAQAQRELAVATKTLAAAQNTVIAAQKAGRTPSPAALAAAVGRRLEQARAPPRAPTPQPRLVPPRASPPLRLLRALAQLAP
jgi:hypothetical protein